MAPPRNTKASWANILRTIQTPLGFYALALLIVETALCVTVGLVDRDQKLTVFGWIIGVFGAVIAIVTGLVIWCPKNLLFGKEEHLEPLLEPSALNDHIEDLIEKNVKQECLKVQGP
jgi:hypothetical protein